jgi:branched-chain amino acid transport system ATP-binding protein
MSALLVLDAVTKRFRGLTALDRVSMQVHAGEIVGVIGPNGSGKTTLFATMSGFLRLDGGAITMEGRSLTGLRPSAANARGLARTFQIVQPFGGLTVRDNVIAGALRGGRERLANARLAAAEVLDLMGLWPLRDQLAATLTIADRKRLEIARALATRPKLLLLDEVMAGLRPAEVEAAIALIRRIRDQGVTIIVVEHLIRAVLALSERMYVLHHGRVIAEGEPREVIHRPEVVAAYFGSVPTDA